MLLKCVSILVVNQGVARARAGARASAHGSGMDGRDAIYHSSSITYIVLFSQSHSQAGNHLVRPRASIFHTKS